MFVLKFFKNRSRLCTFKYWFFSRGFFFTKVLENTYIICTRVKKVIEKKKKFYIMKKSITVEENLNRKFCLYIISILKTIKYLYTVYTIKYIYYKSPV